ncbi:polysaccharide export protein [Pigmentiphaga daeguensis]|uniref:Polysaccharide export protein n=2 Tax=Pigmentiphaga daeguensis TaxID=414049 RepID=A0ABN1D4T9_9BURK
MGARGDDDPSWRGVMQKEEAAQRVDIRQITPETVRELRAHTKTDINVKLAPPMPVAPQEKAYSYLVGAQDVLRVTVWNHPELNNPANSNNAQIAGRLVREDGSFFYPYIGKVQAAGLTVEAIRQDLAKRLRQYLTEPQVDVAVMEYRSKRVFAVGELKSPGTRPVNDVPIYITDLITQSGGLTEKADLRAAVLVRDGVVHPLDLYSLYYKGDISKNWLLQNGDVLNIPERRFNKIFVLGEVSKPQSMLLPYGSYSLAEALTDAGGLNPTTSNAGQVYVIRDGENGKPQVWHMNAERPDALVLADAFMLQPRDVIYVDPAGVTRWARVIGQILPSAQFLRQSSTTFDIAPN